MSGCPAQFIEMWENSWCSIWFHLLVPGGMCTTVIAMPSSPASPASSIFHNRSRPVGAAGVGGDQQLLRCGVGLLAGGVPPAANRHHSERGGVAVGADRYPARVGADVIHPVAPMSYTPVGHRLA
jgi:hypothetical protein